jgi:hypothetical protein
VRWHVRPNVAETFPMPEDRLCHHDTTHPLRQSSTGKTFLCLLTFNFSGNIVRSFQASRVPAYECLISLASRTDDLIRKRQGPCQVAPLNPHPFERRYPDGMQQL